MNRKYETLLPIVAMLAVNIDNFAGNEEAC